MFFLAGCEDEEPVVNLWSPEFQFGSGDRDGMDLFVEELRKRQFDFTISEFEGLEVVMWTKENNDEVVEILCRTFPPPPPGTRSVGFVEEEPRQLLRRHLFNASIDSWEEEYEGATYLVWAEKDREGVERIYFRLFGEKLAYSPDLDLVAELMGCK